MKLKQVAIPLVGAAVLYLAWRSFGIQGLAIAATGLVMWALLHFSRLMHVVRQAADRPVGYVASAVMLNSKLKPKVNLLHVMAMTKSIGEQLSPKDQQPEIFRWKDPGGSSVTCEFAGGRLMKWTLERPEPAAQAPAAGPGTATD